MTNGNEQGQIGLYISILNRAARAYFQKELTSFGVGPGQQAYLLGIHPGEEIPQETLATRLAVDKANVTRAVVSLAKKGLIERRSGSRDTRQRLLSLTREGAEVRREVMRISARWLDYLAEGIDPEDWKKTEEILGKMAGNSLDQAADSR